VAELKKREGRISVNDDTFDHIEVPFLESV